MFKEGFEKQAGIMKGIGRLARTATRTPGKFVKEKLIPVSKTIATKPIQTGAKLVRNTAKKALMDFKEGFKGE